MIPSQIKMPVPFEYVFPHRALFLSVGPVVDFDRRGQSTDDQARDPETGQRLWQVVVMDLDPEEGKFGRSKEVKVKVAADVQPVPPASNVPGYPPLVEFTNLTATRTRTPTPVRAVGLRTNVGLGRRGRCGRREWSRPARLARRHDTH
jgi:hypothetical protein